jgi:peptidoglycan hydrolase-like protein with peptidoglycan-binding domain
VVAVLGTAGPASASSTYYCNAVSLNHPEAKINGVLIMSCYQNSSIYHHDPTVAIQVAYDICYASLYGWPAIAIDGIYGPQTVAAVKRVQAHHGITADGAYGPVTATTMRFPYFRDPDACLSW